MVSFQCDACSDVVKKPKLDQHHSRGCGASFTCIDCSQTFHTPASWKGHTSCITEAEKYQKSLYRPKPNGGGRDHHGAASTGKSQGSGGSWTRPPLGRSRWQATGANGTPLGTPARMSPVTTVPQEEPKNAAVPSTAKVIESKKDKTSKAHGKRKLEAVDMAAVEVPNQDAIPPEAAKKKEKKAKKAKREQGEAEAVETISTLSGPPPTVATDTSSGDKIKKNKSKKEKKDQDIDVATSIAVPGTDASAGDQPDVRSDEKEKKKKKKKQKNEKAITEAGTDGDPGSSAQEALSASPLPEKRLKKRKREAQEDVVKRDEGRGASKKKKVAA